MREKHGMCGTKIYRIWASMKARCSNPKGHGYKDYGGRGIKVCGRWRQFTNFYEDMGDRPVGKSLDRINNDGDYCKENCRWATMAQQKTNIRSNVWIEFDGMKLTCCQWDQRLGLKLGTVSRRIRENGLPIELALSPNKFHSKALHAKLIEYDGLALSGHKWMERVTP